MRHKASHQQPGTARGNRWDGTILGAIALVAGPRNIRAAPCNAAMPNSNGKDSLSAHVAKPIPSATTRSARLEQAAI